jgi:hypothetical protein
MNERSQELMIPDKVKITKIQHYGYRTSVLIYEAKVPKLTVLKNEYI